MDDQMLKK